ncbi:hypothetical protein [Chelatococcus sp. XZ-Ab1]|uniref:hypothetical protein n=1 Tax=Chelatococcus sp. XZ-Ab1 TaxID=3034027 RepID=UPI0023E3B82D|nr:hypothetical protein [Chelatococcus sp. XZ-Ab1]
MPVTEVAEDLAETCTVAAVIDKLFKPDLEALQDTPNALDVPAVRAAIRPWATVVACP